MAETPVERAARLRKESEQAALGKKKAFAALPGRIQAEDEASLAALQATTDPGAAAIRRQGAEQLAAATSGAPQTGLGSRLAGARSIGARGLTAESEFRSLQAQREADLRRGSAERITSAEAKASDADLDFLAFQKELATEQEDVTQRKVDALADVNDQIETFIGVFDDDEEGAANMIKNVALKYKDIDPELYNALLGMADKVKSGEIDIGENFVFTEDMLGASSRGQNVAHAVMPQS